MRRLYVREDFIQVVEYLRENVPGITIATDVICGFPTETDTDFEETMDLLNTYRFSVLHISQFYPRPGTPAARLQKLSSEVVKSRSRKVTKLFESYLSYESLVGMDLDVLVTDRASDSIHYMAHDKNYRPILIPANEEYMGQWVNVTIVETGKYFIKSKFNNYVSGKSSISSSTSKKIPKLIRGQKGLIKVSDSTGDAITGDDGTHLSLPKNGKMNLLTAVSASFITTFLLGRISMRWSLKLGLSFLMFLGVSKYDVSKKQFMFSN
jgi:threonylcarbamoyladenosine tRNA methylthiotransferase CDKAL1